MADGQTQRGEQKVCTFFKKAGRVRGGVRKRQAEASDSGDSDEESVVVKAERKNHKGGIVAKTGSKARKISMESVKSDNEEENDEKSEFVSKLSLAFKSSRTTEREGPRDMGATATLETETQHDRDARAIMERSEKMKKDLQGGVGDNLYRGQSGYAKHIENKDTVQGSAASRKGPQRAPAHLRATTRWDYQPDICKDYKETGYCGFGDTCKFLHDRSDYKSGWQLDLEWNEQRYGAQDNENYEISDDEDDLPFACYLCRQHFKKPVVTRCQHYFCEKCALDHYRKTTRCPVCKQQTGGVFNPANVLICYVHNEYDGKDYLESIMKIPRHEGATRNREAEIIEKIRQREEELRQKNELPDS